MKLNKQNKYSGSINKNVIKKSLFLGIVGAFALSLNACSNEEVIDNFTYNINSDTVIVEGVGTLSSEEVFFMKVVKTENELGNIEIHLINYVENKSSFLDSVYVLVDSGVYFDYGTFVWKEGDKTELGVLIETTRFKDYLTKYDKLQSSYTYDDVMEVWNKVKEDEKTKVLVKE